MIPWTLVDTAAIPGGDGTLRLMQRGQEFSILLGPIELMNSRLSGSEEALAVRACARLVGRTAPIVLIGGYGMGFTLRAALATLGPGARVIVAELVPAVVAWARGPMTDLSKGCLDDRRVTTHEGDVAALISSGKARYDAILLDVDNGPAGQTRAGNDSLYSVARLGAARRTLLPGGVLAVWSVETNAAFAERFSKAGFAVEEIRVRANAGRGARHVIWLGTKE